MSSYQLSFIEGKLSLILPDQLRFTPFFIDFATYHKISHASDGGRQLLYKAAKLKNITEQTLIDATGGWARDAFFLAKQGFKVIVIEQSESVFRLLEDAYERALKQADLAPIMARMELIHANACDLFKQGLRQAVIYLDPMFPERSKSAKVKKDLQILQSLAETSITNSEELFMLAQQAAEQRVIVKRPIKAPFLADKKPSFQYLGKTVRFDVYLIPNTLKK